MNSTQNETNPSAGAMRAARSLAANKPLVDAIYSGVGQYGIAQVIDRETCVAELVAALEAMLETPYQSVAEHIESFGKARAAIAKAKGGAAMVTMTIEPKPNEFFSSHKQYTLANLTTDHIDTVLGFRGDHESDPVKVVNEWRFTADGQPCAIWVWRGSHHLGLFSAWGPREVFESLFPGRVES